VERQLRGVGKSLHTFWLAMEGDTPAGVARLRINVPGLAWNGYTGVDPAYRGRGIARALKLRTILWAQENGIERIFTGNDMTNHRMLSINISLGYEALPADIQLVRDLD
jgi:GNAT superfamily N-acetyltransferase